MNFVTKARVWALERRVKNLEKIIVELRGQLEEQGRIIRQQRLDSDDMTR